MEEYHEMSKYYYDNLFGNMAKLNHFLYVYAITPSTQPIPKPLNPPSNVQALLSVDRAKVSWKIPDLLSMQGRGAWQNWSYELQIIDEVNNEIKSTISQINTFHFTVSDLSPDTKYRFRVAAYIGASYSPYSAEFCGQTLKIRSSLTRAKVFQLVTTAPSQFKNESAQILNMTKIIKPRDSTTSLTIDGGYTMERPYIITALVIAIIFGILAIVLNLFICSKF